MSSRSGFAFAFPDPQPYPQAIQLNRRYIKALVLRGSLKMTCLGDPPGGLADFNEAIRVDSLCMSAYINRAVRLMTLGRGIGGCFCDLGGRGRDGSSWQILSVNP